MPKAMIGQDFKAKFLAEKSPIMEEKAYRTLSEEEFLSIAERILYEDNHLLIFNKKAGEIVQGDSSGDEPLVETLKAYIAQRDSKPGKVFLGIPHRLDRPVSGITVFSKTSKSLERMGAMFRDSKVRKTYWALTCSCPDPVEGEIKSILWKDESKNKSFVVKDYSRKGAKEARLRYRLLEKTQRYFLVEVDLLTGRHHQIRCQLSSIGCPIKGDLKYGAPRSNPDGGICLHSRSIRFPHPTKGEEVSIVAPLPPSWKISL